MTARFWGRNSDEILYAAQEFRDFELTVHVRSHNRVNSGIFLRGRPAWSNRGFEFRFTSGGPGVSDREHLRPRAEPGEADYEERWFLLKVTLQGRRCRVRIDGRMVAETDALDEKLDVAGQVGLQIHSVDSSVEFRDLRIYPLTR